MRKILLSILLCTFAVATWAETSQIRLTFERTGTDANSVKVNVVDQDGIAIEGVSASLTAASHEFKGTAGHVTNLILCPNVNGNTNPRITMTFTINGLSRLIADELRLDIHALNSAGNYQDAKDDVERKWNVSAKDDKNEITRFADIEISQIQGISEADRYAKTHKIHTQNFEDTPYTLNGTVVLTLEITKGSVNNGCFFGLSEIILGVEEMQEPVVETTYQFKGAPLTSDDLMSKTTSTYITIKNLSKTNNRWFVANTGAAPYSAETYEEAAIFVWEPVTEGVAGSYYLKKLDGTYMRTSSPKDFGTVNEAAVFTTTNPTSQGTGSTKFNGDGDSQSYIEGNDDPNLVRFVKGSSWLNVQNGDSGTPTYNTGEGGWTIHYVYELEQVEGFKANISAAKYSTMYTTYSVDLSQAEGVLAYYIKNDGFENEGYITLTEVNDDIIPAYTPVILYAENAGEYTLPCTSKGGTALEGNLLQGSFVNTYVTSEAYVLSNPAAGVGLYKAAMNKKGNTAFLNNGGKAYLPATNVSANSAVQGFKFGDFTSTAIEGVVTGNEDAKVIYDLSGRRLNNITNAGVYIINGKKVMVK